MRRLPLFAVLLGVAGLIPFVGCALQALRTIEPVQSARYLSALVGYGAVILAFLGGVQWGFVLGGTGTELSRAQARLRYRLLLGVLPSLVGWVALLVLLLNPPEPALAVLVVGFVALIVAESELRRRALLPAGYMVLRWALSVPVILILAATLTLRLIHAHIIF